MRKLNGSDVFALARLIRASGMRDELKRVVDDISKKNDKNKNFADIGFNTILSIFDALAEKKSEQLIWEFLAPIMEMEASAVSQLELKDLFSNLDAIAKENDLKSFFSYVSGILGKK